MALRKIPLKLQPYLKDESSLAASDDQEDPAVETFQNRIRESMLRDRAMHDQVSQKNAPGLSARAADMVFSRQKPLSRL